MRRRSSHLVFVMLLLCSVQLSDNLTLKLVNGQVVRRSSSSSQRRSISALPAGEAVTYSGSSASLTETTNLDSSASTAHRTVWTMSRPASAAAAVSNHTSLLRA